MKEYIFSLTFIFLISCCFGQSKSDSVKYVNAVKFIKQDKSVDKYRDKYYFKKANKFKVSKHIIFNYYPLRFLAKDLDLLGLNKSMMDSLCAITKDTSTKINFLPKLSEDNKSDYILYFGRPLNNFMFVVIQYYATIGQATKYSGLGQKPFIILLTFDTSGNVQKAYCSAPIIE